ncbi:MAG: hypothetical protein ACT4P1_17020 [Sporichthyaceae bacterium]
MTTVTRAATATAAALIAGLAFVPAAHGAAAGFIQVDSDSLSVNDRRATQTSTSFSNVRWFDGNGSDDGVVQGFVNGRLTYRGGNAGCVKAVYTWTSRNTANPGTSTVLGTDTRTACTTSSLPREIQLRNVSHQERGLDCVSVKLYYSHAPHEDRFKFDGGKSGCIDGQ